MLSLPSALVATIFATLALSWTLKSFYRKRKGKGTLKSVPTVGFSIPFLGHLPQIWIQGPVAFAKAARSKYGPIFRVNLFSTPFVLVAGKEEQSKFFTENKDFTFNAFFYKWMGDAFFPEKLCLDASNAIARKILKGKVDMVVMHEAAQEFVERLKIQARNQTLVNMNRETERYLVKVGLASFFNLPVGKGFVDDVSQWMDAIVFYHKVNVVLPKLVVNVVAGRTLAKYRNKLMTELARCVKLYRDDVYAFESPFLAAAFAKDDGWLHDYSDDFVAAMVLQLLYGMIVNARLSILNTIADISENEACREEVGLIAASYFHKEPPPWEEYLKDDFIHACVMETGRLRVNFAGLAKFSETEGTPFGDYHIQKKDILSNCSILPQIYGNGDHGNENYDPWRMMGSKNWGPSDVSGWGAGMHACPGKRFSIIEIKLCVAYFLAGFKVDMNKSRISNRDMMGASGMFNTTWFDAFLIPVDA